MIENNNIFVLIVTGIFALAILAWNVLIQKKLKNTSNLLKTIFQGKKAGDLEEVILKHDKNINNFKIDVEKLSNDVKRAKKMAQGGLQKVGVVRYNPFDNVGGDQSFSMALLNSKNDGVIVSSLHSREGGRVYTKPIRNLESDYNLSNEEKQALDQAVKK